jgi:RNA-directed DNA polymerase
VNRYFGEFNRSRRDRWVFGDRDSGAYRTKFAWTNIVRHRMVKGGSSPDDPGLAQYWADRRRKGVPPPLDQLSLRLLKMQAGRCPGCGDLLLHADHPPQTPIQWEQWVRVTGKALRKQSLVFRNRDGSGETSSLRLVHATCRGSQYAVAPA